MHRRFTRKELFIKGKTLVGKIGISYKRHHPRKYATPLFATHTGIFLLATHKRPDMDTVIAPKPHRIERIFENGDGPRNICRLIMQHEANQIIARRIGIRGKTA